MILAEQALIMHHKSGARYMHDKEVQAYEQIEKAMAKPAQR